MITDPVVITGGRQRLRLPRGRLALVMSGSWAVGDLMAAVDALLAVSGPSPVLVCGRNEQLRRRLSGRPDVVLVGWVSDMAALMRTCDVAVLNSGGCPWPRQQRWSCRCCITGPCPVKEWPMPRSARPLLSQSRPRTRTALADALGRASVTVRRQMDASAFPVKEIIAAAPAYSRRSLPAETRRGGAS